MNEVSLCDRYLSYILFFPIAFGVVSPCFALDLEAGLWNHIPHLGSALGCHFNRSMKSERQLSP